MPTVEESDAQTHADLDDLQLLLNWDPADDEVARLRIAVIGTGAIHLLFIVGLAVMPRQYVDRPNVPIRPLVVTKLFDPPRELTQKTPNKGKISKEFAIQSPSPAVPVPTPAPGSHARKFQPPPTPQPSKQPIMAPPPVEPPKIEQAQVNAPQLNLPPQLTQQIQLPPSETKPKLAFENVGAPPTGPKGPSRIQTPGSTVQDVVRELSHTGSTGGTFDPGTGAGLNMPPSPGRPRIDIEMKFDQKGVDFRPYVQQVLAIIRRNWFAVYPESAKLGTRGQVKLEFAILKSGSVNKVAYSIQSGTQALDHAAVAAVSASNPLPALPAEFQGDRIVLAFTFSYNMGR